MNVNYTDLEKSEAYVFLSGLEGPKHDAYLDTATPQQITIGVRGIQGTGIQGTVYLLNSN